MMLQVLPFRARVLRTLAKPLDDKKRLVRKEAVVARSEWCVCVIVIKVLLAPNAFLFVLCNTDICFI